MVDANETQQRDVAGNQVNVVGNHVNVAAVVVTFNRLEKLKKGAGIATRANANPKSADYCKQCFNRRHR